MNTAKIIGRGKSFRNFFCKNLKVETVHYEEGCQIMQEIFSLRYKVMVEQVKTSPFGKNHHMINNKMFYDQYDKLPSTVHQYLRHNGNIIAANRIIDGRSTNLEMEDESWYDIRSKVGTDNIVEPGRLVADKTVRGTQVIPLFYLECCDWFLENNISHVTPMVSNKAEKLISHYIKWTDVKKINDNPISVDSFIEGGKSDVYLLPVGEENSYDRKKFIYKNYLPAHLMFSITKKL